MKRLHALVLLVAVNLVPLQNAVARDLGDIYTQCGLGGLIAPKTPWLAVSTNIIWDLGLTASSSELSSPNSCKGSSAKAAALILQTYPTLERELAQGGGEHVDALMSTASCKAEVRGDLTAALRRDFSVLVSTAGYSAQSRLEQAESLYRVFSEQVDESFSQSCNLV